MSARRGSFGFTFAAVVLALALVPAVVGSVTGADSTGSFVESGTLLFRLRAAEAWVFVDEEGSVEALSADFFAERRGLTAESAFLNSEVPRSGSSSCSEPSLSY